MSTWMLNTRIFYVGITIYRPFRDCIQRLYGRWIELASTWTMNKAHLVPMWTLSDELITSIWTLLVCSVHVAAELRWKQHPRGHCIKKNISISLLKLTHFHFQLHNPNFYNPKFPYVLLPLALSLSSLMAFLSLFVLH